MAGFEPTKCHSQSVVPYHLATSQKNGVDDGTRTHDNQNHNLALYQLNYIHHNKNGASEGIRTPGPRLRRAMLYPAELLTHILLKILRRNGAGEGNRTLVTSLEG